MNRGTLMPPDEQFVSLPVTEFEALADALAWSQQRLRAFGYEADADEVLGWYGLSYVAPKPKVTLPDGRTLAAARDDL